MRERLRSPAPRGVVAQAAGALLVLACVVAASGCGRGPDRIDARVEVADGDPSMAPRLFRVYGCVDCHTIPGIRGATTMVGPPLTNWSRRVYIAGLVPNNPENLVTWLHNPHLIHERSAMPNMGVSVEHARDMAAYLYTLR